MRYVNLDRYAVRTFPIFASSCFRVFAISLIACAFNCATLNVGCTRAQVSSCAFRKPIV